MEAAPAGERKEEEAVELHSWKMARWDRQKAREMAAATGQPLLLCDLLAARGIDTPEGCRAFFADAALSSPFLLKDMDKAVERVRRALDKGEKIAVYGDYDCDGITSTVLMYSYLESAGGDVTYYIPDRETEGYGLNKESVKLIADHHIDLILTVDNGISALEEIAYANSLGVDVVVTDHHQPREELPPAVAVVDPHRKDCPSPCKSLAGVGVAFKLICALEGDDSGEEMLEAYGELVALGTLADVVELRGENRTIVRRGLRQLAEPENLGLAALLEVSGVGSRPITAESVSFGLAPRINACGRLGRVDDGVELLLCEDEERAMELARSIDQLNSRRKELEAQIVEDIRRLLEQDPGLLHQRVLVIAGKGWHHGVVGIAAARLTERFGKPCILFSVDKGEARGSARSVEGFSIIQAISACAPLLTRYGGHPAAAGVTLPEDRLGEFVRRINQFAAGQFAEMPVGILHLDRELDPREATVETARQLAALEPFGEGNEFPCFLLRQMTLSAIFPMGEGKHLRLRFQREDQVVTAVYFGMSPQRFPFQPGDRLDLAVELTVNEYRGETRVSIRIRDLRPCGVDQEQVRREKQEYERFLRGETFLHQSPAQARPTREEAALVYRFLRRSGGYPYGPDMLYTRVAETGLGYLHLRLILQMLRELGLTQEETVPGGTAIRTVDRQDKVDLFSAPAIRRLEEMKGGEE